MGFSSIKINVGGQTVHYLEAGSANNKVLVLLHGSVGDATFHWTKLLPEIESEFHVIAPDLPGFGMSEALPNMTWEHLVEWLTGLYKALNIGQAVIIGNSVGGFIARLFATKYPQYVPALILVNGGASPPKVTGMPRVIGSLPVVGNMLFNNASKQGLKSRESLNWIVRDYVNEDILSEDMVQRALGSVDGLAKIMRVQMLDPVPEERTPIIPTLILWGEEDEVSTLKSGRSVHKAIPSSQFSPIAGTKHAPHIEEPDVVAFQIGQFLNNIAKPPTPNLPGAGQLGD